MERFLKLKEPDNAEIFEIVQKILSIHNENKLTDLIQNNEFFVNYCDWEPVSGNTDNIRYFGNQQTTATGTLSEVVINSIDALLELECIKSGKNPTDSGVPENMKDASELYFGIPNGFLYNCFPSDAKKLSKNVKTKKKVPLIDLAENIILLFLETDIEKRYKTLILYDRATGQSPEEFKNTFLYYKTDNKLKIPFVQGKYGMGGCGIISRCGLKNYGFILSSRHPEICTPAEKNRWGFTIIRKHVGSMREKRDYYEYLCKKGTGNDIFSFKAIKIPNTLSKTITSSNGMKTKAIPHGEIEFGTYIKYFNFDLGFTDVRDVERIFDIKLYDPVLPARIDDGTKFREKAYSWYIIGGRTRFLTRDWINPDYKDGVDLEFTTKHGIKFIGNVLIFKNYIIVRDKQKNFKTNENLKINKNISVLLTYNGQTHATLDKRFLSIFKFPYLKEKILIVVDFRDIMENHRLLNTKFFTADRERLYDNEYTNEFKDSLKSTLESSSILKKIDEIYHKERIEEQKIDVDFGGYLEEFLKKNEELKKIFQDKAEDFLKFKENRKKEVKKKTKLIPVEKEEPIVVEEEIMEKSDNPRILEWVIKDFRDEPQIDKSVKTNFKTFLLQLRTDADLGDIKIESFKGGKIPEREGTGEIELKKIEKVWAKEPSKSLSKGIFTLTFYPTNKEEIGDKKVISIQLMGSDGGIKVEKIALITFDKPVIKEETAQDYEEEEVIMYPALIPIDESDPKWEEDDWNENEIARMEGSEIYVNISSKYYKKYKEKHSKIEEKEELLKDYKLFAYFYTLFHHWDYNQKKAKGETELPISEEESLKLSIEIATVSFLSLWRTANR